MTAWTVMMVLLNSVMVLLSSVPSLALLGRILSPEMVGTAWLSTGLGKSQRSRSHTVSISFLAEVCGGGELK